MPTDDRDRQLDRALARRLGDASRDAACPDAEILAAYHERTLSLEEMAQWKDHIASCSRCQEALALLEESEKALAEDWREQEVEDYVGEAQALTAHDAQGALLRPASLTLGAAALPARGAPVRMPGKRASRLNWRWVAPLGALAAAVIVWVGVRDIELSKKAAKQSVQIIAENREATPPVAASPTPPPEEVLRRKEARVAPNPTNRNPASSVVEPHKEEQAAGAPSAPPKAAPSQQEGALEREYHELGAPKPGATEPSAMLAQSEMRKSRAAAAPPAPSTPAGAKLQANEPAAADKVQPLPQGANETVEVTAAPPTLNTSQSDLQLIVRDSKDLMRLAAEDHRLIVAPGQKYVWHVGDGGSISQSTGRSKTAV